MGLFCNMSVAYSAQAESSCGVSHILTMHPRVYRNWHTDWHQAPLLHIYHIV